MPSIITLTGTSTEIEIGIGPGNGISETAGRVGIEE
jgi:hypothetical protein